MLFCKNLLITLSLFKIILNECLEKENLMNFGWTPLTTPTFIKNPSLCKMIYSESKACVEQEGFYDFLYNTSSLLYYKKQKQFAEIHDSIEEISQSFKELKNILLRNSTFESNEYTIDLIENTFKNAEDFLPEKPIELRHQFLIKYDKCIKAQIKLILGTFCILSSEKASDIVKKEKVLDLYKNSKDNYNFNIQDNIQIDEGIDDYQIGGNYHMNDFEYKNYTLKLEESASDALIDVCLPVVQTSCLYKRIMETFDDLEGKKFLGVNAGCLPDVLECYSENCSQKAKNNILEHIFSPFGLKQINTSVINEIKQTLNKKVGGWYEHIKASFTYTNLSEKVKEAKDWFEQKFIKYSRILEFNTINYFVNSEGRDIVTEGEYSGIEVESSEILSLVAGFSFIVLQLFV